MGGVGRDYTVILMKRWGSNRQATRASRVDLNAARVGAALLAAFAASCSSPEPRPLPPDSFAFGVYGDGPYRAWEVGRFHHVLQDVNRADLEWLIHVGDIFWYPCSDKNYARSLRAMNSIRHPVIYTPGDNEWTDCHDGIAGGFAPLERLAQLRHVFFPHPGRSLGARTMRLTTQSEDPAYAEFVENVRWVRGGFVFATIHMVGSANAGEPFEGRAAADDVEQRQRTNAALAWMRDAFTLARSDSLSGVVLAMHGEPGLERYSTTTIGYAAFVDSLEDLTKRFHGQVLLIHGDSHMQRMDHPLRDRVTHDKLANFTRLETYGSPDIGWVRVVVDSVAGTIIECEPRLMRRWWLW